MRTINDLDEVSLEFLTSFAEAPLYNTEIKGAAARLGAVLKTGVKKSEYKSLSDLHAAALEAGALFERVTKLSGR